MGNKEHVGMISNTITTPIIAYFSELSKAFVQFTMSVCRVVIVFYLLSMLFI